VLTRDHTALPATHTFIHKWNEPYLPLPPSCRASPHFGWYSFPVPLRVGGRVGLACRSPYTLAHNCVKCQLTVTIPSPSDPRATLQQSPLKLPSSELVSWSLTPLFSTNMAISETNHLVSIVMSTQTTFVQFGSLSYEMWIYGTSHQWPGFFVPYIRESIQTVKTTPHQHEVIWTSS